jgi:hypothetical protein
VSIFRAGALPGPLVSVSQGLAPHSRFLVKCLSSSVPQKDGRFDTGRGEGGHSWRSSCVGKGTEVGKHETCVEINEEPGLSGKKSSCQGVVGDEVGRWAGMLHFPGSV